MNKSNFTIGGLTIKEFLIFVGVALILACIVIFVSGFIAKQINNFCTFLNS